VTANRSGFQSDERDGLTVPVEPVARAGSPTSRRIVAVALIVGVVAFSVGLVLGASGASQVEPPARSSASPQPSPTGTSLGPPPGASLFVGSFRLPDLVASLPGGADCVSDVVGQINDRGPSGLEPTHTFVRVWLTFCPLGPSERVSFLEALAPAIGRRVPGDYYQVHGASTGQMVARFPYEQGAFVGSVMMVAGAAGEGLQIAVTVEERLAD
jgi:hypothetical protein